MRNAMDADARSCATCVALAMVCLLLMGARVATAQDSGTDGRDPALPAADEGGSSAERLNARPSQGQDFAPIENRWTIEPPPYQLNAKGRWYDPYNQNILKGDYPIYGDDIFLKLTGIDKTSVEGRSAPTPSSVSARHPGEFTFFGHDDAIILDEKLAARFELQRGSTSFKPFEWQISLEGVGDLNVLKVFENATVSPDVRDATSRTTTHAALQEGFVEVHLMDLSKNYDFVSTKLGRQPFNSDFRSLIFSDVNQGARVFGSANGNRYQYNLVYFNQAEKDTNSELNTFRLRHQQIAIANVYIQDLLALGYQTQFSVHYDCDEGRGRGLVFDNQGFLVRPDPVGIAKSHDVTVFYLGWTSEGHIGRVNVSHAFYEALGHDTSNPIAGRSVDINGQLAFLELSVDRDWLRYIASMFYSSGDGDPRDGTAHGFDSILDNPKILGGDFSYWNRQSIRIADRGGVALMQRNSVIPDLRSSKIQGQANFVNPGIMMLNLGTTAEVTQTLRGVVNATYLRFMETKPLEILLKQPNIRSDIGVDLSLGLEYRPLLNNNIILRGFGGVLEPIGGFKDIFQSQTLYHVGTEAILVF
jgi:hypothetical protein